MRLGPTLLLAVVFLAAPVSAQSTVETIQQVKQKVVKIFGAGGIQKLHSYSTGFLVTGEGHVATVWSHVLDADEVTVVLDNGRKYVGKVIGAEPQLDLAVVKIDVMKIEGEDLPHFSLETDIATGATGDRVLGFNNMFKVATGDEPVSVLRGVIAAQTNLSARRGTFQIPYQGPVYVVDAVTNNPGSNGGALTTRDGKLLGMIGKELRNSQTNTWINYAVPITELKTPIEDIIAGRFTPKTTTELEAATNPKRYRALDFGVVLVPDVLFRTPAYVDSLLPGSAAAKAGLQADDLILFVNDELIQSVKTLETRLGQLEAGDTLRLVVRRGMTLINVEFPVPRKGTEE